jgi:phospholipid/cholesterol/gamma-HCH transport system substrate-binding protein
VKMGGVQVGSVTHLQLPTDPGALGVEVSIGVQRIYASRVRQGSEAAQKFLQYLSGEKYVELTPGDPNLPAIPEGELLPAQQGSRLFEQGEDIADNLNAITISLKEILQPLQEGQGVLGQLIQNPEFGKDSLAKLNATFAHIEQITGDLKDGRGMAGRLLNDKALAGRLDDLGNAVRDLAALLETATRGEGAIGSLTKKGGDAELAIADFRESAASLRRVTGRLESTEGLVGKLLNDEAYSHRLASDLADTVANLKSITAKINEGQGTLGALVNDRSVYDGAQDVVAGVNDSKFAQWLLRHYRKKGIEAPEQPKEPVP